MVPAVYGHAVHDLVREVAVAIRHTYGCDGISVRQLQNLMRDTMQSSNGFRVHVGTFFSRMKRTLAEGPALHRWVPMEEKHRRDRKPCARRAIGETLLEEGEG